MAAPGAVPAQARRAEYAARFNRVVDHIQARLGDPMTLEELAAVACFSPYHFHRLFHGWMGETIHGFINRLRLERAAAQLVYNPAKSITEIALDCGFSSPATFARAFKAFHGVSASAWRENRKPGKADRKIRKAPGPAGTASWGEEPQTFPERTFAMTLQVDVQTLPALNVAYLRHVGPFQEDAALFERLLGRIRTWAGARGLLGPEALLLSISHDDPEITAAERLRLDTAVTVPAGTRAAGEICTGRLEGGPCAVARMRIRPNQFIEAWDALMGGWLPGSGYQPDDRPRLELYRNDPGTDPEGMIDVELALAVKPL